MWKKINNIVELKKTLTELWYKNFWKNSILREHSDAFFQKKVSEWNNIKYFINCYMYDKSEFNKNISFEFDFQFTKNDNHEDNEHITLNWTLFWAKEITVEKIKEFEKEIDNIWKLLKYDYYEKI